MTRPKHFPHRIWAACDFESRLPVHAWFGPAVTKELPAYPGNATALGVSDTPFAAGHEFDDIFFFVDLGAELVLDEVVLYGGGQA